MKYRIEGDRYCRKISAWVDVDCRGNDRCAVDNRVRDENKIEDNRYVIKQNEWMDMIIISKGGWGCNINGGMEI